MTINEAIRDLEYLKSKCDLPEVGQFVGVRLPLESSLQLGIEALRRVSYTRYDPSKDPKALLPGETIP